MAECSDHYATAMTPRSPATTTTTTTSPSSQSARSLSPSSPPPAASLVSPVVASPCAACKILRRRCGEKCVLAPYFPPSDPYKFTIAHRVFGASNINKFLRELPESQRADAVSSMVYEANARIRDPVYGCAGAICHLQKQVSELQTQLAQARAELVTAQLQQADLAALLCMKVAQSPQATTPFQVQSSPLDSPHTLPITNNGGFFDDTHPGSLWEPLWT